MNANLFIICFLCLCQSFLALTDEDCEFLRAPQAMKRVSNNPRTPFRIRFTLKHFPSFCLLRVRIPSDAVVTFNLTRSLGENMQNHAGDMLANHAGDMLANHAGDKLANHAGDKLANHAGDKLANHAGDMLANHAGDMLANHAGDMLANHAGDKLANQIYITNNIQTLMIVNVGQEFGSRFGRYQLNQREVYGVPYHESLYRPILDGRCRRKSQQNEVFHVKSQEDECFDVSGKIRTSNTFRRCLQCNRERGKEEEDFLFCRNCKTKPTLSEDSQELSFAMEDVNESEQYITCQIKTEDDRVNYILRFVPSCPRSSSRSGDS